MKNLDKSIKYRAEKNWILNTLPCGSLGGLEHLSLYIKILFLPSVKIGGVFSFPQLARFRFLSWRIFVSSVGAFSFPQLAAVVSVVCR